MPEIKALEQTIEQLVGEVRQAKDDLDANIKSGKGAQSEIQEKMDKLNDAIDTQEVASQKLNEKISAQQKSELEAKERIDELEQKLIKMKSSHGGDTGQALKAEMKAAREWARTGELDSYEKEERKSYLRSDDNVNGGFLMAESFDESIIKPITETSVLRPHVRTKRIDALSEKFSLRASLCTASWEGEGEAASNTNSTYSQPEIHVHKLDVSTKITYEALLGSRFNMDNEILSDFAETREQKEGAAFVVGDAVKKPRGFMDATNSVPTLTSSTAATYTFDDLIALTGKLKTGYRPMYAMNRTELAFIRTLKDGASNYIWRAGNVGASVPNQINGDPYIILPDMVDKGSLKKPIIYADFMKLYTIVDAFTAIMLRNQYLTGNDRGKVEFSMMSWVGGDVTLPEAGYILQCKTT